MMSCRPITRAIKVVESQDEVVQVGDQEKTKKVIRIIEKYENGPNLEDILLHKDNKDLTILVFSITGKTRGGKSFLLNMMIKYLESKGGEDWLLGSVPSCFAWGEGIDSITKGIWIWPKIYKLRNCYNKQVGILLMDTEGMFDGEMTDGEIIALSGISAVISYLQMFNIYKKITNDHVESIVRNLMKGIEGIDQKQDEELKQDYKLMFLVRDWIGAAEYGYGVDGGKTYIDAERQRGTQEYRILWKLVAETFKDIRCALLPFPGSSASTPQFTSTGDLSMLDPLFLEELKEFIEKLFSPINLIPSENKLTGQAIYNLLLTADGREADDSLCFMNNFSDHANYDKVEKLIAHFDAKLLEIDESDLREAKSLMDDTIYTARNFLKGKSALECLAKLREVIEEKMNRRVVDSVLKQYRGTFLINANIVQYQSVIWPEMLRKLQYFLCGSASIQKEARGKVAQKAAAIYYTQLHKTVVAYYTSACDLYPDNFMDIEMTLKEKFVECTDFGNLAEDHATMHSIWVRQKCLLQDELTLIGSQARQHPEGLLDQIIGWVMGLFR